MAEYQWIKLLAFLAYSVALWIFCRFWYGNVPKDENKRDQIKDIAYLPVSMEQLKNEQLMSENRQLKIENEQLTTKLGQWKDLDAKNKQLTDNVNILKAQNDTLFEALQTVNKASREHELLSDKEFVPTVTGKPENGLVYDSGTSTDEFEAMIQVMKGRSVTRNTYGQAVQAIHKTQGTELYNQLTDRIAGAKQRL
jgi:cell division protein FtsB